MRTIPSGFRDGSVTDLQACWMITRRDDEIIRGTECDLDVTVTSGAFAGVYPARAAITGSEIHTTDDMAVDNLEIKGALVDPSGAFDTGGTGDLDVPDLSAADIEAGMFDNAEVHTFLVNVQDPDLYQHVLRSGWIGNVTRTSDGDYTAEMRGLTQALSQTIVRTYGVTCDAELCDARCKVDMTPFTVDDTVGSAISRREFLTASSLLPLQFSNIPGGTVTFTSGLNTGYSMEIKSYVSLHLTLWRPMPKDIATGDAFTVRQGCNKAFITCLNSYNNLNNFRGHGYYVPGDHEVLKVGKR